MLTVTRAPLSDSWLTALPLTPTGQKSMDAPTKLTMDAARFSVPSINSDLFPELLSWSAIIDITQRSHPSPPLPQDIPSDITEESDIDAETIKKTTRLLSLPLIFDPTAIELGFDPSCFEGLDDQLIYSPRDAFTELCWSDCVGTHASELPDIPPTSTDSASTLNPRRKRSGEIRYPQEDSNTSDESDSDLEECKTEEAFEEPPRLRYGKCEGSGIEYMEQPPPYDNEKNLYFTDNKRDSFMHFESFGPNPDASVGYFPIPAATQPKKLPRRIADFLARGRSSISS